MRKEKALPPLPQPKHFQVPVSRQTWNDGVFSWWNGQHADMERPDRLSGT
jgi:hypothetical protein